MEIDNRPTFLWFAVILANICFLVFPFYLIYGPFNESGESFILSPIFLFFSVVPVLIARSTKSIVVSSRWLIPMLTVGGIIWLLLYAQVCTGKLCDIGAYMYASLLGIALIEYLLFYFLAKGAMKWNKIFIQAVVAVLVLTFAVLIGVFIPPLLI